MKRLKASLIGLAILASSVIGITAVETATAPLAGAVSIGSAWSPGKYSSFHWNIDQDGIDLHMNVDCYMGTMVIMSCLEFHSDSRFGRIYVFPGVPGSRDFFVEVVNPNQGRPTYKNWPDRFFSNNGSYPPITNAPFAFMDGYSRYDYGSIQHMQSPFYWYELPGYGTTVNRFEEMWPLSYYELI